MKNEGDKYSLAQIQADIYGQEIDDGFNKADGKRKSKKKSKKGKSLKQVNNPATNLYNEVNMTFERIKKLKKKNSKIFKEFYEWKFWTNKLKKVSKNFGKILKEFFEWKWELSYLIARCFQQNFLLKQ